MLLLIVGIMELVDLFVLFSDIMQLGELMIRDLSRYSTKMLNYSVNCTVESSAYHTINSESVETTLYNYVRTPMVCMQFGV